MKNILEVHTHLSLRRLVTVAAVLCACASLQAAAVSPSDGATQTTIQNEFDKMDLNHDKQLNVEEIAADRDLVEHFDKADINNDGLLAIDEYNTYKSASQQKQLDSFIVDSKVTAKVKAELVKDSGIKSLNISVETHEGQVILSGFVDNTQQLRRALEIASGVEGVQSVKNGLLVKGS
ncbi:MAG: BON domain-containing protein [Methylophilaceae bacterium]|uniref:BON domain-containing protein n=1 Tax=Methylovorus sp. MM2 TaxID=1848038 RepID=UPI0007E1EC81|nr:BON domain-containing protein [Methylovorus sp. MM2]OAM53223.1 hypothetical protein A7981_07455 [Methylovorus sp. MM2]